MSDTTVVSILQRQAEDLRDRAETANRRAKECIEFAAEQKESARLHRREADKQNEAAARIEKIVREMGGAQ